MESDSPVYEANDFFTDKVKSKAENPLLVSLMSIIPTAETSL
jgi:hypothetical protein